MKAIVLAAGKGIRLRPFTELVPKCLIKIKDETTIIHNELEGLRDCGIKETIIIIGYLANKVVEQVGYRFRDMKITYIENKFYETTNNIYSLWLAKEALSEGTILIEGDVVFEKGILRKLLDLDISKAYWAMDKFTRQMDGCMAKVDMSSGQIASIQIIKEKLKSIGKNCFKSVGMLKISPRLGKYFSDWLDREIKVENVDIYYDLVLAKYIKEFPVYLCNISGMKWVEIDNQRDLEIAKNVF